MRCFGFAASLALCGCLGAIVRAPKQIPASGAVACTDTMEMPAATAIGAVLSAGLLAYSMTHMDWTIEHGGLIWAPVLGGFSLDLAIAAGLGYDRVHECRDAKRQGQELARRNEARKKARAEAGVLWKRAAAAARDDDCATVRELDVQILELDPELHAVVFARDVAIARCLSAGG